VRLLFEEGVGRYLGSELVKRVESEKGENEMNEEETQGGRACQSIDA
jgi:hypothetical protein